MSGYGQFRNRSSDLIEAGHASTGFVQLLHEGVIGAAATVVAALGSLRTTAAFRTSLEAATTIGVVKVDADIYRDSRTIRLLLSCRDAGFNTRVLASTRLYGKASVGSASTSAVGCQPHATTGACVVTLTAPATWINGEMVHVSHGFSSTGPWTTQENAITPHAYSQLSFEDHLLLTVPAAPVLPGTSFDM